VLEKYPKDVKLVVKHFPLKFHKFARKAATAAVAAGRQGKFWEYHDLIFQNFNRLNDGRFVEFAKKLGLDMAQFERDRADKSIQAEIGRDVRDGQRAGVRGTPTIFINGKRLQNRSLQGFQQLIDRELARAGKKA